MQTPNTQIGEWLLLFLTASAVAISGSQPSDAPKRMLPRRRDLP